MAQKNSPAANPLIDYIVIVGPSSTQEPVCEVIPPGATAAKATAIRILQQFPDEKSRIHCCLPLSPEIACFCQPSLEKLKQHGNQPREHLFMLTDKDSDIKRYGVCLNFLCETQPQTVNGESSHFLEMNAQVLSVAIISRFVYFNFFRKCLAQLFSLINDLGPDQVTWWDLIESSVGCKGNADQNGEMSGKPLVRDVIAWLEGILAMSPPSDCEMVEVELSLAPPTKLFAPPPRRFPIVDFPIHEIFDLFSIDNILLVFKLLMCEEKVLIHSSQYWLVPQAVLSFVALMFPFNYLYPIIPLLPSTLPETENLLLVPTPYFIGVETSFLEKLEDMHKADVWLVSMDEDCVIPPAGHLEVPDYPNSEIEVHSDLKQALQKADGFKGCGRSKEVIDDVLDTEIRTAFVKFLFRDDMLGLLTSHMYIIRLFPRPTVSMKSHSFSQHYHKVVSIDSSSPDFVSCIIASQCVRNFLEWTLNPDNTAFLEVASKDVSSPQHLGSKLSLLSNNEHFVTKQVAIFPQDSSSALYAALAKDTTDGLSGESVTSDDDSWVYIPMPNGSETGNGNRSSSTTTDGPTPPVEMKMFASTPHGQGHSNGTRKSSGPKNLNSLLENVSPGGRFSSFSPPEELQMSTTQNQSPSSLSWSPPALPDSSIMCGSFTLQPGYQISPVTWNASNSPSNSPPLPHRSPPANVKESDCIDIVRRVVEGQRLMWVKGHLEGLVSQEGARIALLEALQDQLEVKVVEDKPGGTHLCELSQVGVTKNVYSSVCDLFKCIWKGAIKQFSNSPDCKMKSMFLLLRLSCYIYLDETATKSRPTRHPSVRVKRSQSVRVPAESPVTPDVVPTLMLQSPTAEEGSPILDLSPINESTSREDSFFLPRGRNLKDSKMGRETIKRYQHIKKNLGGGEEGSLERSAKELLPSVGEDDVEARMTASLPSSITHERAVASSSSSTTTTTETATTLVTGITAEDHAFVSTPSDSDTTTTTTSTTSPTAAAVQKQTTVASSPTESGTPLASKETTTTPAAKDVSSSMDESSQGVTFSPEEVFSTPGNDDTFYTPQAQFKEETDGVLFSRPKRLRSQDSDSLSVLNLRGIGDPKIQDFTVMSKLSQILQVPKKWAQHFWNNLVWSLITFERDRLCWNEGTAELARKFDSMDKAMQTQLVEDEDQIISSVIINVSLYMAATGMPAEEVRENLYRYVAKTRVNETEGSMLDSLMKEFMTVEDSCAPLLRKFSLLPLYSETSPAVTFMVHKGVNRAGQLLKLVFTPSSCAVCHFPESYILMRLWFDSVEKVSVNPALQVVSLVHLEVNSVSRQYDFCTKEFLEVDTAFNDARFSRC